MDLARTRWWLALLQGQAREMTALFVHNDHVQYVLMSIVAPGEGRAAYRAMAAYVLGHFRGAALAQRVVASHAIPELFWAVDVDCLPHLWLDNFRWLAMRVRPPVAVLLHFWARTADGRRLEPWLAARLPPDCFAAGPYAR